MNRLATVAWQAPPPAVIDEQLVLYDDGTAWLVARGPTPVTIELFSHEPDPGNAELIAAADRIADVVRRTPRAVATFHVRALQRSGDGVLKLGLMVVASGTTAVQFDLDPERCAVHFSANGGSLSWQEFPELQTGFVRPDASGLGGLNRRAVVSPGAPGALTLSVRPPDGASAVSLQVAGWLSEALPDAPRPERYEVRTAETPIPAA